MQAIFCNISNTNFFVISPAFENNLVGSHFFLEDFRKPKRHTFILDYAFPPPYASLLMTETQGSFP